MRALRFHGLAVLDVGLEVPLLHRLASRGGEDARPLRICNSWIVPSREMSACNLTAPWTFICRASKG